MKRIHDSPAPLSVTRYWSARTRRYGRTLLSLPLKLARKGFPKQKQSGLGRARSKVQVQSWYLELSTALPPVLDPLPSSHTSGILGARGPSTQTPLGFLTRPARGSLRFARSCSTQSRGPRRGGSVSSPPLRAPGRAWDAEQAGPRPSPARPRGSARRYPW